MFRSLIVAGALNYDEFANSLRAMDQAFMVSVKDLRSQVKTNKMRPEICCFSEILAVYYFMLSWEIILN